jgi:hypothetical protein
VEKETRVALAQHPGLIGKINSIDRRDVAEIEFEGGGVGRFKVADLVEVDPATPANKEWPPRGLETKAMT